MATGRKIREAPCCKNCVCYVPKAWETFGHCCFDGDEPEDRILVNYWHICAEYELDRDKLDEE